MNRVQVKTSIQALAWYCTGWLFKKFKMSFIFGSKAMFFSINQIMAPIIGRNLPAGMLMVLGIMQLAVTSIFSASIAFNVLIVACRFPTICAALYLQSVEEHESKTYLRIGLGMLLIACFALFACHPVGRHAWAYTTFWVLPLTYLLVCNKNIWLTALSSTLMAHALGSVLSLYFGPQLTPTQWLSLIPVVIIERIIFAGGIVVGLSLSDYLATIGVGERCKRFLHRLVSVPSVQ